MTKAGGFARTFSFAILSFLFVFLTCAAFAPIGFMDMTHEAQTLIPASQILAGKMMFRDVFSQYGFFPALFHAGAMELMGFGLLSVRLCAAFFLGLAGLFLFLSWRLIVSDTIALAAVAVWAMHSYHFMHPLLAWPSVYALAFQSVAVFGLMLFLRRGNWFWLIVAGMAAAGSTLCKQNVGMFLFGALLVAANIPASGSRQWRPVFGLPVLVGFFAVAGTFWGWLHANEALAAWWTNSIEWPAFWSQLYGNNNLLTLLDRLTLFRLSTTDDPFNVEPNVPDLVYLLLPISCGIAFAIAARRFLKNKSISSDRLVMGLCLLCGASWLQYYPVPGIGHVWWSSAPMFAVPVWLAAEALKFMKDRKWGRHGFAGVSIALVVLFAPGIVWRSLLIGDVIGVERVRIGSATTPMNGIYLARERAERVQNLDAAIGRHIDRSDPPPVLLLGDYGMLLGFIPGFESFHRLWMVDSEYLIDVVDPDYEQKRHEFIVVHEPVILARGAVDGVLETYPQYQMVEKVEVPRPSWGQDGPVDTISILIVE